MARPIKETPILYGEDARRFEARMKERRRISPEERARINADYELVLGMLKRGEELKQHRHAATSGRTRIFPWLTSTDPHDCISKGIDLYICPKYCTFAPYFIKV